jgi:isocitrate dehydrogenase kinase/phosphatase
MVGEVFADQHADICTVEFWRDMQLRHEAGELPDFFPYPARLRFHRES